MGTMEPNKQQVWDWPRGAGAHGQRRNGWGAREPWEMGAECSLGGRLGLPLQGWRKAGRGQDRGGGEYELRMGQLRTSEDGWGKGWKLWGGRG